MSSPKLKPCPFCGGEPEFHRLCDGWYVAGIMCTSCAANVCSQGYETETPEQAEESAIKAWNSRVIDERLVDDGK